VGAGLAASFIGSGFVASSLAGGFSCEKAAAANTIITKKAMCFMELPCFPETIPEEYPFLPKAAN
jgi:hypothetical protein